MENKDIGFLVLGIYILIIILIKIIFKIINIPKLIIFSMVLFLLLSFSFVIYMHLINKNEKYQGLIYFFYAMEINIYYVMLSIASLLLFNFFKK